MKQEKMCKKLVGLRTNAGKRKVEIVNANERKGFEVRNFRQEVGFTKNFFVLTTDDFLFICNFLFFLFFYFFWFCFEGVELGSKKMNVWNIFW